MVRAHFNLGNMRRTLQDLQGAVGSYRAASALDPTSVEAWVNLGSALLTLAAESAPPATGGDAAQQEQQEQRETWLREARQSFEMVLSMEQLAVTGSRGGDDARMDSWQQGKTTGTGVAHSVAARKAADALQRMRILSPYLW
jgi:hypothetical protein